MIFPKNVKKYLPDSGGWEWLLKKSLRRGTIYILKGRLRRPKGGSYADYGYR